MTSSTSGQRRPDLSEVLREPTSPADLLQAVRARMIGRWQRENRAPRTTAALLRELLPNLAAQTVAEADRALAGMLVLPGTGARPYYVGDPPDWYANPVNDNEYLWILNRHGHWRNLLAAYSLTGDACYGAKVVQEVRDWIARVPRPPIDTNPDTARPIFRGIDPWRLLETGIRMFESWPLILDHLIDGNLMTPELLAEYVVSLYQHGEELAEVSPVLFPDANHNMHTIQNRIDVMITVAWRPLLHCAPRQPGDPPRPRPRKPRPRRTGRPARPSRSTASRWCSAGLAPPTPCAPSTRSPSRSAAASSSR